MSAIGRISCTVEVPARGELPAGAIDRVRGAMGDPLPRALAEHLGPWVDVDPGSVWVLRRVRADVRVPATDPVDRLAARLAVGLEVAVDRALRAGLGTEVVRFASRVEHLAGFVAALATGTGDLWVFDRFDGLRLLAPLTALRTAVRGRRCTASEVVVELARSRRLDAVVARATGAELARTWALCCDEHRAAPVSPERAEACLRARLAVAPRRVAGEPPEALALRLLGTAGLPRPVDAEVVGAIWSLLPVLGGDDRAGIVAPRGERSRPGAGFASSADAGDEQASSGPDPLPPAEPRPAHSVFAARGAPVFLALPSFDTVGAEHLDPTVRRQAFALALGVDPHDPAIVLAAGEVSGEQASLFRTRPRSRGPDRDFGGKFAESGRSGSGDRGTFEGGSGVAGAFGGGSDGSAVPIGDEGRLADAITATLVQALIEDDRLDPGKVAVEACALANRTVWVARDSSTDTWLAAAAGGDEPPGERLAERLGEALGRPVVTPGATDHLHLHHLTVAAAPPHRPDRAGSDQPRGSTEADLRWLVGATVPEDEADLDLLLATALVARAGLKHLARRLLGFERSSLAYIVDRFLIPGGVVDDDGTSLLVELPAPPLQVVLTMAGLDTFAYRVAWLDRDVVVTHQEQ